MKRTLKFKMEVLYPTELEFLFDKYWEIFEDNLKDDPASDKEWKVRYPNLFFGHIQSARRCAQRTKKAMKALDSSVKHLKKNSITLEQEFKIEDGKLWIGYYSRGRGRKSVWFGYNLQGRLDELDKYRAKTVSIIKKNNEYFVHITVDKVGVRLYEPETVLGIDRGLKNIAVAALTGLDGKPIHNLWYFSGGEVSHKRRNMRQIRQEFGCAKRVDKIKQSKWKEHNFVKDVNHKISRQIVDIAQENKSLVVLEDLRGIKNSKANWGKLMNYQKSSWSYYQLKEMILYKAEEKGVPVVFIDPRNTSKMCSKCGETGNRDGLWFSCPHCGYQCNADGNGALNIAHRGLEVLMRHCMHEEGITEVHMGR